MKGWVFAIGLLAVGFVASTPARADFAVVKFNDGACRVWVDTSYHPWDGRFLWFRHWHHWRHWHRWSFHTATWERSEHRLHRAVAHGRCHF
jgi:hypothetical protein